MCYKIKVYKIVNDIDDKIYVGSTRNELRKRFNEHKANYYRYLRGESTKYISSYKMFDTYSIACCHIILLSEFEVENREQMMQHERRFFDKYKSCIVNINRSYVTDSESKEKERIFNKAYRDTHKDNIKAQRKIRRVVESDKVREVSRIYRETNKDKIAKQRATKYVCDCGTTCSVSNRSAHNKTAKHLKLTKEKLIL